MKEYCGLYYSSEFLDNIRKTFRYPLPKPKTPPYDGGVDVMPGFDEAVARDCTWPELPSRSWVAPNNTSRQELRDLLHEVPQVVSEDLIIEANASTLQHVPNGVGTFVCNILQRSADTKDKVSGENGGVTEYKDGACSVAFGSKFATCLPNVSRLDDVDDVTERSKGDVTLPVTDSLIGHPEVTIPSESAADPGLQSLFRNVARLRKLEGQLKAAHDNVRRLLLFPQSFAARAIHLSLRDGPILLELAEVFERRESSRSLPRFEKPSPQSPAEDRQTSRTSVDKNSLPVAGRGGCYRELAIAQLRSDNQPSVDPRKPIPATGDWPLD